MRKVGTSELCRLFSRVDIADGATLCSTLAVGETLTVPTSSTKGTLVEGNMAQCQRVISNDTSFQNPNEYIVPGEYALAAVDGANAVSRHARSRSFSRSLTFLIRRNTDFLATHLCFTRDSLRRSLEVSEHLGNAHQLGNLYAYSPISSTLSFADPRFAISSSSELHRTRGLFSR